LTFVIYKGNAKKINYWKKKNN